MKKRTFKKLVTGMAIGLLFSTTLVYGGNTIPYSFTLNPTQVAYSSYAYKTVDDQRVYIKQSSSGSVIEYTVVNVSNVAQTEPITFNGADSEFIPYKNQMATNISLRLKVYNDPAKNAGGIRNASGSWVP